MSGAMGTVRAYPKRSEGPEGIRWEPSPWLADYDLSLKFRCSGSYSKNRFFSGSQQKSSFCDLSRHSVTYIGLSI